MARRASLEIKVGIFIVLGLVLLVAFIFAIGGFTTFFQPGYNLRMIFDSANGIGKGSPVQYAGVEQGKVRDIQIVRHGTAPRVELVVWLPREIKVRTDDVASISAFGLLGEKYVEIAPGPGQGSELQPGDVLEGKPPVSTEQVIERSNQVLSEFQRTLEGLNSVVGDPETRLYLTETMQEARDALRNWKLLGERLNLALSAAESGQGSFGKLLYDDELYQRLLAFVEDLHQHPWKLLVRPKPQRSEDRRQKTD